MPPSSIIRQALEALASGKCVAILDSESREGETDLFFPAATTTPGALRTLRTQAGGELYIAIGSEVATTFGLPYMGQVLAMAHSHPVLQCSAKGTVMCQGSCSVGISLDHRSLKTGASDVERSYTCRRLAGLWGEHSCASNGNGEAFGREFHAPGHIFLCVENSLGLRARQGHTELSVALAKAAGISPLMVGCVMLCNEGDDFGALPLQDARFWAEKHQVPFLAGQEIFDFTNGLA
ncbi:hypothetical protein SELMODRAFT_176418 [Selaginella moellendorffii]|uniref:3,4-dihydroxy-2-butanone-4-phosphate synthase n=1 Tax=Selaginella moellendorffii TaxID=88036 RepID=D8S2V6_SELML|nr:hypothetical protein SELMODRAFT_176418 [Selaginella moellendorffii]